MTHERIEEIELITGTKFSRSASVDIQADQHYFIVYTNSATGCLRTVIEEKYVTYVTWYEDV